MRTVINDVRLLDPVKGVRPAETGDVIKDDLGVKTGIKSRAELIFQDQTLTRLGPETYFSFQPGTRDMTLGAGTMLLQVPKKIGGARTPYRGRHRVDSRHHHHDGVSPGKELKGGGPRGHTAAVAQ